MRKEIYGKYTEDSNFITVFCSGAIYTIAKNSGEWGKLSIGQASAMGQVLDQSTYNKWEKECKNEGTFVLV